MFLCILSGFAIVIALLALCFCDCVHARACVLFKVTKSVTVNWGLFLWLVYGQGLLNFLTILNILFNLKLFIRSGKA